MNDVTKEKLDELYREYGKLLIESEIIQANIRRIKEEIVNEMNKKK